MKKITAIAVAVIMACTCFTALAHKKCDKGWKEKMQSEKIAFLTMELDITPEEAQSFWPVYNRVEKDKDAAFEKVIQTYKALNSAIEAGNSSDISKCLDEYLQAQEKMREEEGKAAEEYRKVLPVEKVARLYVAEEKFRRQHIRKLHGKKDGGGDAAPQANK